MVGDFLKSTYKYIVGNDALKRQSNYQKEYKKLNEEYYDKEMQYAVNLFNRNYYRNYLDTPTAQRMLKETREMLGEQTRSLRNTSTVMGLTGESMAAMQKNNNKILDKIMGNLSVADVQEKERALYDYNKVRSKLDEFIFNVRMDDAIKQNAFKEQKIQNKTDLVSPSLNRVFEVLGDKLDAMLPDEIKKFDK